MAQKPRVGAPSLDKKPTGVVTENARENIGLLARTRSHLVSVGLWTSVTVTGFQCAQTCV